MHIPLIGEGAASIELGQREPEYEFSETISREMGVATVFHPLLDARRRQGYLHTLLERLTIGVYRLTVDGHLIEASPALLRRFGLESLARTRGQATHTGSGLAS